MGLQRECLNTFDGVTGKPGMFYFYFLLVGKRHHPRIQINARKTQTHLSLALDPSHKRSPSFLPCKCYGDCFTQGWRALMLQRRLQGELRVLAFQ